MSWNYSGDPSSSPLDAVRWFSGDRDIIDQLVQDEEIAFQLVEEPDPRLAAASVCDAIAAQLQRQADASTGDVKESKSQKAKGFLAQASRLRRRAGILAAPKFGGLSRSEKDTLDQDTDAVQPSFRVTQFDNPEIPNERDDGDLSNNRFRF